MMEEHHIVDLECINLQYGEGFAIAGHENQVFAIVRADAVDNEEGVEIADQEEEELDGEDEFDDDYTAGDEITTTVGKKRSYAPHWATEVTQQLIATRLGMEGAFAQGTMQRQLWRDLAAQMVAHGHQVKAGECLNKWKNLLSTYRKNKEKAERGGERSVTWEHFQPLHAAFGQFAHDLPPASYLRASTSAGLRSSGWSADRFVRAAAAAKASLNAKNEADAAFRQLKAAKEAKRLALAEKLAQSEAQVTARWAAAKAAASGQSDHVPASPNQTQNEAEQPRVKRKRKQLEEELSAPDWFQSAVRHQSELDVQRSEQRNQLWAEFRQLEERKLKAMSDLMVAASRLRDKSATAADQQQRHLADDN